MSRASKKHSAQRRATIARKAMAAMAHAEQREIDARAMARPLKYSDLRLTSEERAALESAIFPR